MYIFTCESQNNLLQRYVTAKICIFKVYYCEIHILSYTKCMKHGKCVVNDDKKYKDSFFMIPNDITVGLNIGKSNSIHLFTTQLVHACTCKITKDIQNF